MRPRPLYRWKSFWLGLFVACFLAWACWDSMSFQSGLALRLGGGTQSCVRHTGSTYFLYGTPAPSTFWRMRVTYPASHLESSLEAIKGPRAGSVKVPDFVSFVCFLGLWSAWLFWHWKREQKKSR
jgi:hypothetical protein